MMYFMTWRCLTLHDLTVTFDAFYTTISLDSDYQETYYKGQYANFDCVDSSQINWLMDPLYWYIYIYIFHRKILVVCGLTNLDYHSYRYWEHSQYRGIMSGKYTMSFISINANIGQYCQCAAYNNGKVIQSQHRSPARAIPICAVRCMSVFVSTSVVV